MRRAEDRRAIALGTPAPGTWLATGKGPPSGCLAAVTA
jgi:hypothetical protein